MRATVCGHHVRQRNDEKLADLRSETLIMWHKSPSPPRSVVFRTFYVGLGYGTTASLVSDK